MQQSILSSRLLTHLFLSKNIIESSGISVDSTWIDSILIINYILGNEQTPSLNIEGCVRLCVSKSHDALDNSRALTGSTFE